MDQYEFSRLKPTRNERVNVGTSVVIISEDRTEIQPRTAIILQNASTTAGTDLIYIYFGSTGTASTTNFVLDVNDVLGDVNDGGYVCNQGTVTAVCATANGKLNIIER